MKTSENQVSTNKHQNAVKQPYINKQRLKTSKFSAFLNNRGGRIRTKRPVVDN